MEGFKNLEKKRVHDAGTRFQQDCPVSIHENVREYQEAGHCFNWLGIKQPYRRISQTDDPSPPKNDHPLETYVFLTCFKTVPFSCICICFLFHVTGVPG